MKKKNRKLKNKEIKLQTPELRDNNKNWPKNCSSLIGAYRRSQVKKDTVDRLCG
jgi:hypothetical protein